MESGNVVQHEIISYDKQLILNREEMDTILNALKIIKKEAIIIPSSYILTLRNSENNVTWELYGDSYCLRDSTGSYFIPKGKTRKSYLLLLSRKFPKMKINPIEDEGVEK